MKDTDVNGVFDRAAKDAHAIDPALLKSISDSISPMRPVRQLASNTALTSALVLTGASIALAGAARAGFYGIAKMTVPERLLIFSMLTAFTWIAGTEFVDQMIPGSRRRISPGALVVTGSMTLFALFAILFRDYHTEHFVHAGLVCLATGFLHAVPAGLLSWFILRRGFALNPVSAGLVAGTLAGLAGITVLELHCANFQALHVIVWHTAVLPLAGLAGAAVGWMLRPARQR